MLPNSEEENNKNHFKFYENRKVGIYTEVLLQLTEFQVGFSESRSWSLGKN